MINSGKKFANKKALGTIVTGEKGEKSTIEYKNYGEFLKEAHAVGSGIINK